MLGYTHGVTTSPPPVDDQNPASQKLNWWERRTVTQQAGVALLAVLLLFTVVFYGFALLYVRPFRPWPWSAKDHPSLYDLTRNAATVAALLGGAVAIAVTLRRQRSTERTVELTEETARVAQDTAKITAQAYELDQSRAQREEVDRLRDRYTTIAGQLGHDAAPVRLAGVYAMAALANDWLKRADGSGETQVCIDVLCAYLRTPRHTTTEEDRQADIRVRETITRVVGTHVAKGAAPAWTGKTFDFTGAVFAGTHVFDEAEFKRCKILLAECKFDVDCRLSFDNALFENCHVSFRGVELGNGCRVSFDGSVFSGRYLLTFGRAQLHKGSLLSFEAAEFVRGRFLSFGGADFNDGCRVSFSDAIFRDRARMMFTNAKFDEGSQVSFAGAEFNDTSSLLFNGVGFDRAWPTGPWGDEHPPYRWPPK